MSFCLSASWYSNFQFNLFKLYASFLTLSLWLVNLTQSMCLHQLNDGLSFKPRTSHHCNTNLLNHIDFNTFQLLGIFIIPMFHYHNSTFYKYKEYCLHFITGNALLSSIEGLLIPWTTQFCSRARFSYIHKPRLSFR